MSRWFRDEFGFEEPDDFPAVQQAFTVSSTPSVGVPCSEPAARMSCLDGGRTFHVGPFEDPTLRELRARVARMQLDEDFMSHAAGLSFHNMTAEARSLHLEPGSVGGVFQVASQFNCLEMVGPGVSPEQGVTRYAYDRTQGPACAMAAPAATVWRNYFWNGRGQAGGSEKQLDTARTVGEVVSNGVRKYWRMQNGYLMPFRADGISDLNRRLQAEEGLPDAVRDAFRVGVHWDTQVAVGRTPSSKQPQHVAQVFCSAIPVTYARLVSPAVWAPLAKLTLDALYE